MCKNHTPGFPSRNHQRASRSAHYQTEQQRRMLNYLNCRKAQFDVCPPPKTRHLFTSEIEICSREVFIHLLRTSSQFHNTQWRRSIPKKSQPSAYIKRRSTRSTRNTSRRVPSPMGNLRPIQSRLAHKHSDINTLKSHGHGKTRAMRDP